ncbi:hypothetical protein J8C06_03125 [Chloracidobacterium validum]|uniref:Bacterial sensory transduction regulator n=1 Tax=Chloracidobacterium validum TaxID=2821543 RepID=A0ABX8B940_9BACT|nr:hypothetical protein [Chloracidobacterium validum]QUW03446.1 hypothetical protein J8C06_03125 [Chloracidobacterium validum]
MRRHVMLAALGIALIGAEVVAQETAPTRRKAPSAPSAGTPGANTQAKPPATAKPATTGQTPPDPNAPRPKPLHETLRGYLRQIKGVRLERADKDPNTIVSRYRMTTGEEVDIVVIHSPRKKMVGLYSYAFGNLADASDADDLRTLLLNANEALAFGSFFVDKEQDIGLKWSLRTEMAITFEAFQTVYLGLAAAAKEYAPQIARRMKNKNNGDDAKPATAAPRDQEERDASDAARSTPPNVTRARRASNPQ